MSDLISRKRAIKALQELNGLKLTRIFNDSPVQWIDRIFLEAEDILKNLPSEKSKWEWIPVTEKLPEEETDVLVCSDEGNIEVCRGSMSTEFPGEFIWYTSGWRFGDVIAWMPLPEPYVK